MATLTVKKSQAVKLFDAMGLKTAKKWDLEKLTEKINDIQEVPDKPLEDEEMDALLDELMEAEEAVVVDDDEDETTDDDEEPDEDAEDKEEEDEDEDKEDEDEDGDEDEDEDGDEDEEEPKKKSKKTVKKSGKNDKKDKKPKKERGESIDNVTVALLKQEPMSLEKLHKALTKKFPDHDSDVLLRTTRRRLTGHLQSKGFKVHKDDKGKYSIGSKKKE